MKWDNYFLKTGKSFDDFWSSYLNAEKRNVLYIFGLGFDPRMTYGYNKILNFGGNGRRDCLMIEFDEGAESPSLKYNTAISPS